MSMPETPDMVAFIKARLDEDEATALAIEHRDWREDSTWFKDMMDPLPSQRRERPHWLPMIEPQDVAHMARHDPSRVLREVAAKRAILDEHASDGYECRVCCGEGRTEEYWDGENETRHLVRDGLRAPCPTVVLLAAPFRDHPDYPGGAA